MCEELRRALVQGGAAPGEANGALFPLFAQFTLETFSRQVLEYRWVLLSPKAWKRRCLVLEWALFPDCCTSRAPDLSCGLYFCVRAGARMHCKLLICQGGMPGCQGTHASSVVAACLLVKGPMQRDVTSEPFCKAVAS